MCRESGMHGVERGKRWRKQNLTYRYRGVLGARSRNSRLCHLFWLLSLELRPGKSAYNLIRGEIILSLPRISEDLTLSSVCYCLSEALSADQNDEKIYRAFKAFIEAAARQDPASYFLACKVMVQILKEQGIAPNLTECVLCSSKKGIVSLDMQSGGFVCKACRTHERIWPKKRLQLYSALFKNSQPEHLDQLIEASGWLEEFIFLCEWYEYYSERRLASLSFLKEIIKLEHNREAAKKNKKGETDIT